MTALGTLRRKALFSFSLCLAILVFRFKAKPEQSRSLPDSRVTLLILGNELLHCDADVVPAKSKGVADGDFNLDFSHLIGHVV